MSYTSRTGRVNGSTSDADWCAEIGSKSTDNRASFANWRSKSTKSGRWGFANRAWKGPRQLGELWSPNEGLPKFINLTWMPSLIQHMLTVADTAVEKYRYMEIKVKEMELQLERTSHLSTFNHHRLNCKVKFFNRGWRFVLDAPFRCRNGGRKYGSYCYQLSRDTGTWAEAQLQCERLGGMLAVIKTKEVNIFIVSLIKSQSVDSQVLSVQGFHSLTVSPRTRTSGLVSTIVMLRTSFTGLTAHH